MGWLEEEVLLLLRGGSATVEQLETATGRPAGEVWRALTRLFADGHVRPVGTAWTASHAMPYTA